MTYVCLKCCSIRDATIDEKIKIQKIKISLAEDKIKNLYSELDELLILKAEETKEEWKMQCLGCRFYDKNSPMDAWGTCEPQDVDFHANHICNLSKKEICEIEGLTGMKQADKKKY